MIHIDESTTKESVGTSQQVIRDARREKRQRSRDRKEAAADALVSVRKSLGLSCALIRLALRGGATQAAFLQARALFDSFVQTAYMSVTGAAVITQPADKMIAVLRVHDVLNSETAPALMAIAEVCETEDNASIASVGRILTTLELIALGSPPTGPFSQKSVKRRQVREATRAIEHYYPMPFEPISRANVESMPTQVEEGKRHRLLFARLDDEADAMSVGGMFNDTPEDLRGMVNAVLGLQSRVPDGLRVIVENVEPWTEEKASEAT